MARTLSDVRQTVKQLLKAEFNPDVVQDWEDDEIDTHIQHVVEEISQVAPNVVREVFLTTEDSKELDISDITNLIGIERAEYPVGSEPRDYRNIEWIDNETIEIKLTSAPDTTGTSGTLTGTVTFTHGSTAVTGSGTLFTTELAEGYHIKKSTGTRWYRIASITSATALVLAEVCRETTGADVASSTPYYDDEVAYLFCNKLHELTDSDSTLKAGDEKVVIDGAVAYTALSYIGNLRVQVRDAVSRIADVNKAIDNISDRITQSIDDLTKGRGKIEDERTDAATAIGKVDARILQALTDLELGRTYINKINYGGNPESDYGNMASRELQTASEYLRQASAYMNQHATSGQYGNYASRELQVVNGYVGQAGGYLREMTSRLSIAGVINTYQTWANNKLALYRRALAKIETPKNWKAYPMD